MACVVPVAMILDLVVRLGAEEARGGGGGGRGAGRRHQRRHARRRRAPVRHRRLACITHVNNKYSENFLILFLLPHLIKSPHTKKTNSINSNNKTVITAFPKNEAGDFFVLKQAL